MLKILHRINDPKKLAAINPEFGVEMDIHAFGSRLVVHHDAMKTGPGLEEWLDSYSHKFCIFNIKEEGVEELVRDMVLDRGINDFFMLDLSFPALFKMIRSGESRVAIRVSEYEAVYSALTLAGLVDWVWLDVFRGFPINKVDFDALKTAGFQLCLVSPELHGGNRTSDEIAPMKARLLEQEICIDAVCTKAPDLW